MDLNTPKFYINHVKIFKYSILPLLRNNAVNIKTFISRDCVNTVTVSVSKQPAGSTQQQYLKKVLHGLSVCPGVPDCACMQVNTRSKTKELYREASVTCAFDKKKIECRRFLNFCWTPFRNDQNHS